MFAAVGIVAAVLLVIICVTIYRRRRASRFDRDVAEAAAAAAASSRSPFDDDVYADRDGPGNPYNSYSPAANKSIGYSDDHSHGTYAQPPMQPMNTGNASYPMSEYSHFDPYAGHSGDPYSAGAAALGTGFAGVGAASNVRREPSKRAPYNAFARPRGQETTDNNMRYGARGNNGSVLEAVGLGGSGAAAMAERHRRHSGNGLQGYGDYPQQQQGGHPQQFNQEPAGYGQGSGFQAPYPPQRQDHNMNSDSAFDPYGVAHASNYATPDRAPSPGGPLPNPHAGASQQHVPYTDEPEDAMDHEGHEDMGEEHSYEHGHEHEHDLASESDGEDERSARVLKVANE